MDISRCITSKIRRYGLAENFLSSLGEIMYIPKVNEKTNVSVLHSLIKSHSLGTWVIYADGELVVNHILFLLDNTLGKKGTLVEHVTRENPAWKLLSSADNSLVIFHGAETYITLFWYPSKHEHSKAAPTWDCTVIHVHGMPRIAEDRKWLLEHINVLTDEHESNQALPWKASDASEDFIEQMLKRIVDIEIQIEKLEGKWKVNQNKQESDQLGVVAALLSRKDSQSIEMAFYISRCVSAAKDD